MKLKMLGLSAVLMLCLTSFAFAQDKKEQNVATEKAAATEATTAIANNILAARLAQYARGAKDPMALASAAQIYAASALKEEAREKTDDSGAPVPAEAGEKGPDAQAVFAEALAMAKDQQNSALAALIEKQAKAAGQTKGRVGGAARHVDTVRPGTNDVYRISFRGGEQAMVGAESRYGDDIDIEVYDENGNFIARDADADGVPVCAWTPRWTGQFIIKVVNPNNSRVHYTLMTN